MNWIATNVPKAQFMPQAIHESAAFNSCNRKVAIHCVFSVKENTHCTKAVFYAFLGSFGSFSRRKRRIPMIEETMATVSFAMPPIEKTKTL